MAWKICVDSDVPDSITGPTSRKDASTTSTAMSLTIVLPPEQKVWAGRTSP